MPVLCTCRHSQPRPPSPAWAPGGRSWVGGLAPGSHGRFESAQVAAWLQEFTIDQTIGAGLNEDIERIIYLAYDEFEKQEGPRFKLFTEVWQKTCLGQIFSGRESFREMFEFSEELFLR